MPPRDGEPKIEARADRIVFERGRRKTAFRLPRHGVLFAGVLAAALVSWSVGTGAYILFHDTVVAGLRSSAKATAKGYEAQIAALKDEIERSRTRRLVEKTGVEERLAEIGLRQETLEKRQARLAAFAAFDAGGVPEAASPALAFSAKPTPMGGSAASASSVGGLAELSLRPSVAEKITASLDALERGQEHALDALAQTTFVRRVKLERVYDAAGVPKPAHAASEGKRDGKARGGPYLPVPAGARAFDDRLDHIALDRDRVDILKRGLDRVPIRTPAAGADLSSGFGMRTDPFLGRPAFHAGLDFEQRYGEPVRATAAGRVIWAGASGGYGEMVEIDHGGGLTTRFGHLSSIGVSVGVELRPGALIGRVGSTGRSTGPHLHYETRVDGEAVDPLRFLRAGALLSRAD